MHVPWHWCGGQKAILSVHLCLSPYLREGSFVQHCVYQVHNPQASEASPASTSHLIIGPYGLATCYCLAFCGF